MFYDGELEVYQIPEKFSPAKFRGIRQSPPDVFVIDLARRPSHGREVAVYLRGQKATRHIPIVFVDGVPEKVAAIRKLLPDAVYATSTRLRSAVREALAHPPASPVVPPQMMERYSSRTAAQKLGIREGTAVALVDPPRNYAGLLAGIPAGVRLEEGGEGCPVTLWFVSDAAVLREDLAQVRRLVARTKLWILWRKGTAGVTQPLLRESAAAVGLVDYKICSVNQTWSAMLFARKRKG